MNELLGNSPEVEAKEILFTEIFDRIAEQKLGEEVRYIPVRENNFSSSPEVTKTIVVQRLLNNERLQRNIYKTVKKQERPKDSDMRHLIIQEENNTFKLISIRTFIEDGKTYFDKTQEDEEIEGDREPLAKTAREIKDTLAFEIERLEEE